MIEEKSAGLSCWCGNIGLLETAHPDYLICQKCGTAQLRRLAVLRRDDESVEFDGLYTADYWQSHQKALGLPDINERARTDIAERCIYWLRQLIQYRLPPARVLEIGCAHGAFLKLLNTAGFQALGMEMNSTTIEMAKSWFGVSVVQGPIEKTTEPIGQFDVIVMFDVIEHLTDPLSSLSEILKHLAPEGIMVIQTPRHTRDRSTSWMHYNAPEHTFLYSAEALEMMFKRLGVDFVGFEPPIFIWDMFAFASRHKIEKIPKDVGERAMQASPDGRLALAMLDLYRKVEEANRNDAMNILKRWGPPRVATDGLSYMAQKLTRKKPARAD